MHPRKPLIRIRHLLAVMLAVGLLSSLVVVAAQAADPLDIETAIAKGVEALAGLQNADGSWGDPGYAYPHPVATTCLALVKLQESAYELNDPEIENPFDPDYEYSSNVFAGWQFVLNAAEILKEPIPVQNAGDPDVNGNEYGLDFATAAVPAERYGYTQGIVLMALASTGTPSRPNDGGLDFDGDGNADTYLELAQEVAEHIAYGQVDFGSDRGGWHYGKCNNGSCAADNSVTGYTVLGLAYAEDFGVNIPAWVKSELNVWINSVQNPDGGSMYSPPSGSSNILRTGNLIFEMTFVDGGGAPSTARFQNALAYIENNWHNTGWTWGWGYSLATADYQAMYTLMKGLEYSDIDLIDTEGGGGARDDDWFNQEPPRTPAEDFASVLVAQQNPTTGLWPSNCHQYGCQTLCQIWALLILEKAAPPPPPPPVIEVSVDIKPRSCPNPLNVRSKGVLPVAILGTEEFDVMTVDPASIRLNLELANGSGVPPIRWAYEDVATPYLADLNGCHELGPDGYLDLTLKFDTPAVVALDLSQHMDGETVVLQISGNLKPEFGGTSISGQDVIRIIKKK